MATYIMLLRFTELRLIEKRGAPLLVNVKKYKNALSKTAKKMIMIWIYEIGK